jgi:hypothetical protein
MHIFGSCGCPSIVLGARQLCCAAGSTTLLPTSARSRKMHNCCADSAEITRSDVFVRQEIPQGSGQHQQWQLVLHSMRFTAHGAAEQSARLLRMNQRVIRCDSGAWIACACFRPL